VKIVSSAVVVKRVIFGIVVGGGATKGLLEGQRVT